MLLVMRSMVLSMDKTMTFAKNFKTCMYERGRIAIIDSNPMKTLII
jgi:hypothetical protein